MSIEFNDTVALLRDIVSVEDAEPLLAWLTAGPDRAVDLSGCTHLHPANLQVLLATRARVLARANDATLDAWLQSVLPCA